MLTRDGFAFGKPRCAAVISLTSSAELLFVPVSEENRATVARLFR
jgi:hypothetical protein